MNRILLLPGDGIGPEVTEQAARVLETCSKKFELDLAFEHDLIGGASIDAHDTPITDAAIEHARACRAVLLGAVGGPKWDALPVGRRAENGLLRIRKELQLFANLRPASVFPALVGASSLRPEVVEGIDLLVVRELTGGIYFGEPRGQSVVDGLRQASNTMVYNEAEIARIARVGFEAAQGRRKELCHVHKANVLEVSQLWVVVVDEIAQEYPDVALSHQLVDSMAMLLLREPRNYDVIVTGNLFGDILSDEAAMITGSLGMLASASLGEGGIGLYEPVHGSAPDIAGQDVANPIAAILSVAMLLEHTLGEIAAAQAVRDAVAAVLDAGHRTGDLVGSSASTRSSTRSSTTAEKITPIGCVAMGDKILEQLESA